MLCKKRRRKAENRNQKESPRSSGKQPKKETNNISGKPGTNPVASGSTQKPETTSTGKPGSSEKPEKTDKLISAGGLKDTLSKLVSQNKLQGSGSSNSNSPAVPDKRVSEQSLVVEDNNKNSLEVVNSDTVGISAVVSAPRGTKPLSPASMLAETTGDQKTILISDHLRQESKQSEVEPFDEETRRHSDSSFVEQKPYNVNKSEYTTNTARRSSYR